MPHVSFLLPFISHMFRLLPVASSLVSLSLSLSLSFVFNMKIQAPSQYSKHKPSIWRSVKSTNVPRFLVTEKLKPKHLAGPTDDKASFVSTNDQVKDQGIGFNICRYVSGQLEGVYLKELVLDRYGLYTVGDAKDVSVVLFGLKQRRPSIVGCLLACSVGWSLFAFFVCCL